VLATAYEAKALTRPDGRQASANIWKLIEMAADIEDKSARGIGDFIVYLQSVSESSETEAEARIVGEEEDVVRILTVHAAKGLEFPVVVLADLGGEDGRVSRPAFFCSMQQGLGARLRDPEGFDFCEDAAYSAILEEEKKKEEEEADRLLYVAMTRAKEHLILSGVLEKEKKSEGASSSRMRRLEEALASGKVPFRRIPAVNERPRLETPAEPLIRRLDGGADDRASEILEARLAPVTKAYEAWEDLTVSRLVAAAEPAFEPSRGDEERDERPVEEEEATPRNEFGTMFHLLMELSARSSPRGSLAPERLETLTRPLTANEKGEIGAALADFWKSPLGTSVKKASKCHPELPFIYKTRHGLLKGQIDLVFREKDGWAILDYKTNRLAGAADKDAAVKTYSWQLGLYALAFWKLYGEIPARTLLYFTALGETAEVRWSERDLARLEGELDELYRKALDF
jgi:ATP-dependent helicase/nuclease subunit A